MKDGTDLESTLLQAPIGFAVIHGPAMTFTAANARYLEMVSRTDIVGRAWTDVFPELVGTPTHAVVERVYEGERVEVRELQVDIRDARGALHESFFSFTLDPTREKSGAINGFVCIAVDVSELVVRRREAETLASRLKDSEDRYRMIFEAMDDGFCLLQMIHDDRGKTVDYRFLEANDAFMRHTGLTAPVGKTARELVPDLDDSWFALYGKVADTGESTRFENAAPAMARWFDVFASRVGAPERRQVGLVFKDVTARKRVEEEKERLLVAATAARLEAEAANRLKDDFLATVSHELRTPLNAMLGWVTMLRAGNIAPEKQARALETVERNARSQAQLVEDLLDVSRILEGKLRLEVTPLELSSIVEMALETVRPSADAKHIRLQAALSTGGTVLGDAHRLQQIVWNLLSNAVKFTPKGGRVQVLLEHLESSVEMTIADNGIGIAADFQPFVFERFRQAEGSTTRSRGGLGLGLSIVRHLVEMHGGTVGVFSDGVGHGATFTVRLPFALARRASVIPPALPDGPRPTPFQHPPELEGLHVLAVDDEEDSREMLRALLESCNVRVRVAASVADALRMFEEERPGLVLSDIGMPVEDGFDLIRKIRALPTEVGGDVPAVALTAYARTEDRTRCLLAGFNSHVPKPIEPLELVAVMASLAGRNRSSASRAT